jgi:hypothetical protein
MQSTNELMPVIMVTMMMRTISWRKLSGPSRGGDVGQSTEGVAEDQVYLER